ncbi:hypothetical protein GCM10009847_03640 [Leucobacter tardus]
MVIGRSERLITRIEVDDRETHVAEPGRSDRALTASVGAAMTDPVEHGPAEIEVGTGGGYGVMDCDDSTHTVRS